MPEKLLQYYNRELAYLRRQGAEFARAYPKVAGHLRMSDEAVEDPHVSRLLEGVAFLTAQIRERLDDHFPELTDVLLGTLYPDYQMPIPSMTMLELEPAPELRHSASLPGGQSYRSTASSVPSCRFRTPEPQAIAPIQVREAAFENLPFEAPRPDLSQGAGAVIRVRLGAEHSLAQINAPGLRFYLHGQPHLSHEIHDLIHRTALGFALVPVSDRRQLQCWDSRFIQPVGFLPEEALLPWGQRSFPGYRLLVEHFLFPEKFLFAQLDGMTGQWPDDQEADLYIYLAEGSVEQEKHFTADHMRLNCAPAINLFEETLEPRPRDQGDHEYLLSARFEQAEAFEVVAVDQVNLLKDGRKRELAPYYGMGHPHWQSEQDVYWHLRRRPAEWAGGEREPGTDSFLTLVDRRQENLKPNHPVSSELLLVNARCSNRNMPARLPFGGGEPGFSADHQPLVRHAKGLVAPTDPVRPELEGESRWQFVRHLTLEHFSGPDATARLKGVLQLHDFRQRPESQALIDGIESVTIRPAAARVRQGSRFGLCQGSDVCIHFSRPRYAGTSIYLFASVLDRFFAQFAQVNSFTRLRVRHGDQQQDYHVWPARLGSRGLL